MWCLSAVIALVAIAFGVGILIATVFPPWILVWFLGIVVILIGVSMLD